MTEREREREWLGHGLGLDVGRWGAWGHAQATADKWEGWGESDIASGWRGIARAMLHLGRERRALHMWLRHARYGRDWGNV